MGVWKTKILYLLKYVLTFKFTKHNLLQAQQKCINYSWLVIIQKDKKVFSSALRTFLLKLLIR